jgi:pyruvate/2-oxoglutarate/acetoin dehydrogenase E1 component/TPP-dependent pyruvate/acetoin dehydrogenase alpha subunit
MIAYETLINTANLDLAGAHTTENEVLHDYWLAVVSREASLIARKEVLSGKAKFGIVGDGKELPQILMAKQFRKGDWRSGYYRDQTFMFATGLATIEDFFAQLYADPINDPFSGGRQMNNHFATQTVNKKTGEWLEQKNLYNVASDTSNTGGQMPRALGLALASRKYRLNPKLAENIFSDNGNEVSFVTIGDASTSEGHFWETINAAGVMKVPLAVFVWDDGYGISVPTQLQTTKGSISEVLQGFKVNENNEGWDIYTCKGWDYLEMQEIFEKGIKKCRETHIPCLFHVRELTQPQGHSTSGSHERYKSPQRLVWEKDHDCVTKLREHIINNGLATEALLAEIEENAKQLARNSRKNAYEKFLAQAKNRANVLIDLYHHIIAQNTDIQPVAQKYLQELKQALDASVHEIIRNARRFLIEVGEAQPQVVAPLRSWYEQEKNALDQLYEAELYSDTDKSPLKIATIAPTYGEVEEIKTGYEIMNAYFEKALTKYPDLYAFGEDVGAIGDVNQGFAGMQAKFGVDRVFDVGIRELTIMGQALGMSMRGLRTIAEIQYLDYIYYGLELLADDVSCVRWRSNGIQQSPCIIRSRGHRLEGIWHSGSPLGTLIGALRGMHLCVPRNFVQAAGMYNTLLKGDDPAMVIEVLNAYRQRERMPNNLGEYTVPLGKVEVIEEGTSVTLLTYGACVRIAQEATKTLKSMGIFVELIDVQTLLPFDIEHDIVKSLAKTNRLICLDEDVPGGATAYMLQEVLEKQYGYRWLDAAPRTITAKAHRPPFGSDGDYFSKPNAEDIIEAVLKIVKE